MTMMTTVNAAADHRGHGNLGIDAVAHERHHLAANTEAKEKSMPFRPTRASKTRLKASR